MLVSKVETRLQKAVDVEEPLENALKAGLTSGAAGVPVTEHNKLLGIVRMSDLWKVIQLRKLV